MAADFWIVPESLDELPAILHDLDGPWWVAGGWAIDLAVGRVTRPHEDLDVTVFFDDQEHVRRALRSWELRIAVDGELLPWNPGEVIEPPHHQLWARRGPDAPWSLEVLFERRHGDDWVYRRDQAVRLPVSAFGRRAGELPFVAPEVQLLYKAASPRPKDHQDFRVTRPVLSSQARDWLRQTLGRTQPGHDWLDALAEPPRVT